METSKWEGTKEKVFVEQSGLMKSAYHTVRENNYPYCVKTFAEQQANARLFTDALHTIQECGMMPSELRDENEKTKHAAKVIDRKNNQLRDENAKLKGQLNKWMQLDARFTTGIDLAKLHLETKILFDL